MPKPINILVIGSGAREHALCWKLAQSPSVGKVFCAPGNPGTSTVATNVPIKATDAVELLRYVTLNPIDLTVVGPEQPLIDGIVDLFEGVGIAIFGPTKAAAELEGSKVFAKQFMERHGIPTAKFRSFDSANLAEAKMFVETLTPPIVIKADGLAAGKGVVIADTRKAAADALDAMMKEKIFGDAGNRIVIEEFLRGEEASILALTDGREFIMLPAAQDHKRIFDGDQGKNTGGMGAYAPAPVVTATLAAQVADRIIKPTLEGMRREGRLCRGCLYVGLMMTEKGPFVIEYNSRFGDPEAEVVLPLIDDDLAQVLFSIARGSLGTSTIRLKSNSAVCVVMASKGYPDSYETGKPISGLENSHGAIIFHAGTKADGDRVLTAGGRVLAVTALGPANDLASAIRNAYDAVHAISFEGAQFRADIGRKGLNPADR